MEVTRRARPAFFAIAVISFSFSVARAAEPDQKPIPITGRVVDSAGQPIKGVMCFWVWSKWSNWGIPTDELVSESVSDSDGRFELKEHEAAARHLEGLAVGMLWFVADGYAVQWQTSEERLPNVSRRNPLDVVLKPARKFSYRVIGPDGRPRLGELIEPIQLNAGKSWGAPPRPVRELLSGTTDESGTFTVNTLAAEDGMLVRVISEKFGTVSQLPNLARGMPPVVTVRLRPVGVVEGVIEGPGVEAFAGRTIQISTCTANQDPRFPEAGMADAVIDAQGRFRAPAIAEGDITINLDCPPGLELERRTPPVWGEMIAGQTAKISVSVTRLIPIRGRVRMADGSAPSGDGVVIVPQNDVHREIRMSFGKANAFHGSIYPGEVTLQAELRMLNDVPVVRKSVLAQTVVKVDKLARDVDCPDLVFPKVRMVQGQALDASGQPLTGATIYAGFGKSVGAQVKTDAKGQFQFAVGESTPATGSYSLMRDERTLMPLEKTDDPLIVRMPQSSP